jgi:hypothetical protein
VAADGLHVTTAAGWIQLRRERVMKYQEKLLETTGIPEDRERYFVITEDGLYFINDGNSPITIVEKIWIWFKTHDDTVVTNSVIENNLNTVVNPHDFILYATPVFPEQVYREGETSLYKAFIEVDGVVKKLEISFVESKSGPFLSRIPRMNAWGCIIYPNLVILDHDS